MTRGLGTVLFLLIVRSRTSSKTARAALVPLVVEAGSQMGQG